MRTGWIKNNNNKNTSFFLTGTVYINNLLKHTWYYKGYDNPQLLNKYLNKRETRTLLLGEERKRIEFFFMN